MESYSVYVKRQNALMSSPLLRIPVADIPRYSSKPLKWIRFVMAAILGCQGDLFWYAEENGEAITLSVNLEETADERRNLLFTPDPQASISFIDVDGLNDRASTSGSSSNRDNAFKNGIGARDGSCVVSNMPLDHCQACHLIPHSKGDQHIQTVFTQRATAGSLGISSIDSIQNGLLLDFHLHKYLTDAEFAVLCTPNFALSTDEAVPNPTEQNLTMRFTPHFFKQMSNLTPIESALIGACQGDLRHPIAMANDWPTNWPPSFIWDFVYGTVVYKRYGNEEAGELLKNPQTYHPGGVQTVLEPMKRQLEREKEARTQNKQNQTNTRTERARQRGTTSQQKRSDIADVIFNFWMSHSTMEQVEQQERRRQEQLQMTADKVNKWRQELENC